MKIPIDKIIITGDNPRQNFDEEKLRELGNSIKEYGQLQQIIVKPSGKNYELIVGERRLRAFALIGLSKIEAEVRDVDDIEASILRLEENIHREDLTDKEKGDAVYALWAQIGGTLQDIADKLNVKKRTMDSWCDKSRKLSPKVNRSILIGKDKISETHALLLLKYPHNVQERLAKIVIERELSKRQLIELIKKYDVEGDSVFEDTSKIEIIKHVEVPRDILTEEQKRIIEERKQLSKISKPKKPRKPRERTTKKQVNDKVKRTPKTFKYEPVKVKTGKKGSSPPLKREVEPTIKPIPNTPDYSLCKCAFCPLFGKHCKGRCWK